YRKYKQKENLPSGSEAAFIRPYKYSESIRFLDDVPHTLLTTTNISDDSIETHDLSSDDFCAPPKKKKINLELVKENITKVLEAASTSIEKLSSLANKIDNANLTMSQINDIESAEYTAVHSIFQIK
ncbi:hypothetical protein FF38_04436, partial [Lucilia cuprina]